MRKLIFQDKETTVQFVKFSIVGILNTAIHYSAFFVLFRYGGIYYLLASGIGYCAGLINSYLLNRRWTFEARGNQKHREVAKFLLVNIGALALNTVTLKCFVSYMEFPPEMGQVFAIVFSWTANFLGNKLWTFKMSDEVVRTKV